MKLLDIIWKEISIVKSQKIAILLIVLYPFLAIVLLAAGFSGTGISQIGTIDVGVVNNLDFNTDLITQVSEMDEVNLIEYSDVNTLRAAIKRKEIIVGLAISGKDEFSQKRIDMIYDNSNLISSQLFLGLAKTMIQRVTFQTVQTQLGQIWGTLSDLGKNLEEEINQVDEFKQMLADAEGDLDNLENDLEALDFAEIEQTLSDQETTIKSFDTDLDTFNRDLDNFKTSFNTFKNRFETLKTKLIAYESKLIILSSQIAQSINLSSSALAGLYTLKEDDPDNPVLNNAISDLESSKKDMDDWSGIIDEVLELVAELKDEESSLNSVIAQTDNYFVILEANLATVDSTLSGSGQDIANMNKKLSVFKESIDEVKDLIANARTSKAEIESKLNSSDSLLSSFSGEIINFSKIDPAVLARPVVFYEAGIFKVNTSGIMASNATAIVLILTCLLLTSISVITEKNQNVSLRMQLSPTKKLTFVSGKLFGQLIIALIEAAIIFAVAAIVFDVNILGIIFDLALITILIALSFISLGLLITFFTKNQSTAILLSLLVVIPLLFISGVIIPLDFMTPVIQTISGFMPLTIANNLLIGVIIKGAPLFDMLFEIGVLAGIIIAVVIIALIKKESYKS